VVLVFLGEVGRNPPRLKMVTPNPPQVLLKVTLKKIPTLELVFGLLVGPPGLEPEPEKLHYLESSSSNTAA